MCTPPLRNGYVEPRKCNTIQEVMCNVVVYVEVMTIDEDRSAKIKMIAGAMGAQVNDKLYKNTTHVIFREGSVTTYKKAIKMGIPLVSVTWLEECRKTLTLADPDKFPPINLQPYERPELYKRIRVRVIERNVLHTGNKHKSLSLYTHGKKIHLKNAQARLTAGFVLCLFLKVSLTSYNY